MVYLCCQRSLALSPLLSNKNDRCIHLRKLLCTFLINFHEAEIITREEKHREESKYHLQDFKSVSASSVVSGM